MKKMLSSFCIIAIILTFTFVPVSAMESSEKISVILETGIMLVDNIYYYMPVFILISLIIICTCFILYVRIQYLIYFHNKNGKYKITLLDKIMNFLSLKD